MVAEQEVEKGKEEEETKEKVIQIRRVTKVVKGGKRMGFRAGVAVGNGAGEVGFGLGKAAEVSAAIRKGVEEAKKSMVKVPLSGFTIPHEIVGKCGASKVLLKPAPKGRGIIAGGAVRTIIELAGIKNLVSKSLGSPNAMNVAKATLDGLARLKILENEAEARGKRFTVLQRE